MRDLWTSIRTRIFHHWKRRLYSSQEVCSQHFLIIIQVQVGNSRHFNSGTAGLGQASVEALAKHSLAHIYFSGRNREAGRKLIAALGETYPKIFLTYVQVDLTDLSSIKNAVSKTFVYNRLDILLCNAGIMATPAGLSRDGYEIQFATNHLGHAMLIKQLLPVLLKTAERPGSDVRIVSVTSTGGRCIRALKASSFHNYVQPKTVCLASGFGMGKMVPVCCFPFINMANAKHIETTEWRVAKAIITEIQSNVYL